MDIFKEYINTGENNTIRFENPNLKLFVNSFIDFNKY